MSTKKIRPQNLVVIMSDEHSVKTLGFNGNPVVRTPNIDRLAASGTTFSKAYCNSPVCVPARASFATGQYVHQCENWDNADPYYGKAPSWHHRLRETGHRVESIGKLHFRQEGDDNGFSEEQIPMHIFEAKGDLMGLVREQLPRRGGSYKMAEFAVAGESPYTTYDRAIAARAQTWLHEEAPKYSDRPWVLFVSFVCPHFPLTAPPEHFYSYYNDPALPMPKMYDKSERPDDPYLKEYGASFAYDEHFDTPDKVRRAIAGYYGLCTFLDENIGKVMKAIEDAGLGDNTRIVYTSDHGDNLGSRGVWGKSTMYEEAAAVPFIMSGADVPVGAVCDTPVTHVDAFQTILHATGVPQNTEDAWLPGASLFDIAAGDKADRVAFSEYHGMGSTTGAFMVRHKQFKYVHFAAYPPQLFDLDADPEETRNLVSDPAYADALAECQKRLFEICDPAAVDAAAKRRQADQLAANGGREKVIARGDLGFSPPPGLQAEFA